MGLGDSHLPYRQLSLTQVNILTVNIGHAVHIMGYTDDLMENSLVEEKVKKIIESGAMSWSYTIVSEI